ncbi:MAG: diaminopimelate decarboxylase [Pontiellaceae bacterium]|nr:diaminopimelate decarboxylase [Pontiellaceae bacterium]
MAKKKQGQFMNNGHSIQVTLPFASDSLLIAIADEYGTPLYVHDENSYRRYGREALAAPNAFGLSVRYAMKANSHRAILSIFDSMGIGIDASSGYEVRRALAAGIAPDRIKLTSQQVLPAGILKELVELGVVFNATSLLQLRRFAELFPGNACPLSVRINPGLGSGHNNRTNTAGRGASFGIWKDYLPEVLNIANQSSLTISRLHSHVGSGSDWRVWQKAARMTLDIARDMPDVRTVNLGGGYRIDRMTPENSMDFQTAFSPVKEAFEEFAAETGRELLLEIEPGSYLAANSCILLSRINDIVDTGVDGYRFLKLDASMTELLRPMIYGDRHSIRLLARKDAATTSYVVVGMCCESGDLFTPKQGNPEEIDTVLLPEAETGDFVAVMGAGAYSAAMSVKNYNSRPACAEVMILSDGSHRLITRAQDVEEIWSRELQLWNQTDNCSHRTPDKLMPG